MPPNPYAPAVADNEALVAKFIIGVLSWTFALTTGLWLAYVVRDYWVWFVQPTFAGPVPPLSAVWGLVILVRYMLTFRLPRFRVTPAEKEAEYTRTERTIAGLLLITLLWAVGSVIHATGPAVDNWAG